MWRYPQGTTKERQRNGRLRTGVDHTSWRVIARIHRFARTELGMVWRRMLGREELTPVEARQGFLDRPVLVILITSTAMVCIVFAFLLLGY